MGPLPVLHDHSRDSKLTDFLRIHREKIWEVPSVTNLRFINLFVLKIVKPGARHLKPCHLAMQTFFIHAKHVKTITDVTERHACSLVFLNRETAKTRCIREFRNTFSDSTALHGRRSPMSLSLSLFFCDSERPGSEIIRARVGIKQNAYSTPAHTTSKTPPLRHRGVKETTLRRFIRQRHNRFTLSINTNWSRLALFHKSW